MFNSSKADLLKLLNAHGARVAVKRSANRRAGVAGIDRKCLPPVYW
jgi:hypothetical protein